MVSRPNEESAANRSVYPLCSPKEKGLFLIVEDYQDGELTTGLNTTIEIEVAARLNGFEELETRIIENF